MSFLRGFLSVSSVHIDLLCIAQQLIRDIQVEIIGSEVLQIHAGLEGYVTVI